jgi:hypothetical protein
MQRSTGLPADPAFTWLSPPARWMTRVARGAWGAALYLGVVPLAILLGATHLYLPLALLAAATVAGMLWLGPPVVGGTLGLSLVQRRAEARALTIADWSQLARQPDGVVVSLVGWVRGRDQSAPAVEGSPGVFQALHDFDLVDERREQSIPIRVAGGRLLSAASVAVPGEELAEREPGDAPSRPTATGFVLRDGDAVRVIGFKDTLVDPTFDARGVREPALGTAIRSDASRPLLIFPLVPTAR